MQYFTADSFSYNCSCIIYLLQLNSQVGYSSLTIKELCKMAASYQPFTTVSTQQGDEGVYLYYDNYPTRAYEICIRPFHIVTGIVQHKYTNNKPQLYFTDIHVQVLIAFND